MGNFNLRYRLSIGTEKWTNNFTVQDEGTELTSSTLMAKVDALTGFLRTIHLQQVQLESVTVSKHYPAGHARSAADFVTKPIGLAGLRSMLGAGNDTLPLVLPVRLDLIPATGRAGSVLIRGAVTDEMWDDVNGVATLNPEGRNRLTTEIAAAVADPSFPTFVIVDKEAPFDDPGRPVLSIKPGQIVSRKLTTRRKKGVPKSQDGIMDTAMSYMDELMLLGSAVLALRTGGKWLEGPKAIRLAEKAGAVAADMLQKFLPKIGP